MSNLISLPDETLLEIFEYFRLNDIKNLRLTCKRFYSLSLDKNIIKNEYLLLNERVCERNATDIVAALMASTRNFDTFTFENDIFEERSPKEQLVNVIAKFGENIKQVFYFQTNMEFSKTFKSVIDYCPNLEGISIKKSNDLFLQESLFYFYDRRLIKMKSLKIYSTQYLSDLILRRFFRLCPNLEEITLFSCGMNVHNGVYGKFYKEDPSDMLRPSNDVFNYKYLLHLLRGLNVLTDLNLSFNNLTYKCIADILQLPNVKLRALHLLGCGEISWPKLVVMDIFSWQKTTLTTLNLSNSYAAITNPVLLYISSSLVNLETLALANCYELSDEGFAKIQNLKKLKELNINNNDVITGEIISNLKECPRLVSLRALLTNVHTEHITKYLAKLKLNLCEIGFIQKATLFTDDAIKEINKTQSGMKEFHIHSLSITNNSLIGAFAEDLDENLETLFMNTLSTNIKNYNFVEHFEKFRQIFRIENIPSEYSISNLRHLEILNLNYCRQISDKIFKYSMDLPCLRKLSLCDTQVSFVGVCYLVQRCPNLEYLNLEHTLINDASICILVQALPKLSHLNVKYCSKLSPLSCKFIAKHNVKLKVLLYG